MVGAMSIERSNEVDSRLYSNQAMKEKDGNPQITIPTVNQQINLSDVSQTMLISPKNN